MSTDYPTFTKTFHSSVYPSIDPTNKALSARNKVVLVTGGGQGIGKAIAIEFAKAGARAIIVLGRTRSTLENATKEISEVKNSRGITIVRNFEADICNTETVYKVFQAVRDEFGGTDIVINNAGSLHLGTIESSDVNTYYESFDTNVKGTLNIMTGFARYGLEQDRTSPATFINLSSCGVGMPIMPTWSAYVASKLAVFSMTQFLAAEMAGKVRTFSIHPGRIATDMAVKAGIPTFEDPALPGAFCVWLSATSNADFLQNRLLACNWDVDELLELKNEIEGKGLLKMSFGGLSL